MPRTRGRSVDLPGVDGDVATAPVDPCRTKIVPSRARALRAAADELLLLGARGRLLKPVRWPLGGVDTLDVADVVPADGFADRSADEPPDAPEPRIVDRRSRLDVAALRAISSALAVASRRRCRRSRSTWRAKKLRSMMDTAYQSASVNSDTVSSASTVTESPTSSPMDRFVRPRSSHTYETLPSLVRRTSILRSSCNASCTCEPVDWPNARRTDSSPASNAP
mmetsp:Transcript_334/g.1026  ORF Transcript_334/g.1026 Transcript_334/m.1026 type:complete len:223 (-) Transcript_334:1051-1719(-)